MKLLLLCKIIYNLFHHEGFNSVCLDVWVLQTAYHYYRQRYGEAEEKQSVSISISLIIIIIVPL